MIDVYDQIKDLLVFTSEDDFYYLQILQRKKDNPDLPKNTRVIKNYFIRSIEYLEGRYSEIQQLCNVFNARAMLRLNKRSLKKTTVKTLQNIANAIANEEYLTAHKAYTRACGQGHNSNRKTWLVDIDYSDTVHLSYLHNLKKTINECLPICGNKIVKELPTKTGTHLITYPFNIQEFRHYKYKDIDIHKDNPINLYIP